MLKLNLAIAKEVATGKGKIDIFFECFSDHRTLLSGNGVKIRQNPSGPADHILSRYLTFSGKGLNRYHHLRP
ncbi:MAG: hypothetical protein ACXU9K_13835 [Thermodesulfobacteriota bacterium]